MGRIGLCLLASCLFSACARAQAVAPERGGFAIAELFTSEGCSSCPPADAVLADLTREAARAGSPLFTLAFHVDYWDSLGWRDPYSASWASQHQRAYAAGLHSRGLYTPQLVVDGRDELIGSHAGEARSAIARATARPRRLQLQLQATKGERGVSVRYGLTPEPPSAAVLRLALVEPEASGTVRAGENAGRVLSHVNVVRAFESVPLSANAGQAELAWPSDLSASQRGGAFVVGYVQGTRDLEISAAARANLN
jgi:hypothetical protein